MYALYSALIVLFAVAISPWLVYQAVRYRKYVGSVPQRLGYLPVSFNIDAEPSIWIHAVSVGELLTARVLFTLTEGSMMLLHGFIKKTQKTPNSDLKVARGRIRRLRRGGR